MEQGWILMISIVKSMDGQKECLKTLIEILE